MVSACAASCSGDQFIVQSAPATASATVFRANRPAMRSHHIDPLSPVSPSTPSRTNALSAADALEVAARLLAEGLKNLDAAPESALVACGQALGLEVAHGDDDARLARACAAVCRALSRLQLEAHSDETGQPLGV